MRPLLRTILRRLTAPTRCQHPRCTAPATHYDPLLDIRTCAHHAEDLA